MSRLGIHPPNISSAQRRLAVCKNVIIGGSVVGVTIGCLLGASCLLFMDLNKADRMKKAKELETILQTVMEHGDDLIQAEVSGVCAEKPHELLRVLTQACCCDDSAAPSFGSTRPRTKCGPATPAVSRPRSKYP